MRKFWPTSGFARARGLAVIAVVFLFPAGLEADTFSYDAAGRLYSSQQGNGLTITYAPDAEANILSAASSGTDTTDQGGAGNGLPDWWEFYHLGERGSDPLASSAGDGVSNLMKYALGVDPAFAIPGGLLSINLQTFTDGNVYPTITYIQRSDAAGLIVLEQSGGGGIWQSGQSYFASVGGPVDLGNGTQIVTYRSLTAMPAAAGLSFRLTVSSAGNVTHYNFSPLNSPLPESNDIPALPNWALILLAGLFILGAARFLRSGGEAA